MQYIKKLKAIIAVHVAKRTCAWCGEDVGKLKDELSEREYAISGMCQMCQDDTFGKEEK